MKPVFFLMQICPILPGSLANGLRAAGPPENLLTGFQRPRWSTRGSQQQAAPRPWWLLPLRHCPHLAALPRRHGARAGEGISPTGPTCPRTPGSCGPGHSPDTEDQQVVARALH